uniref:SFRICE_015032 n=1 Tax=Spodoptera frugiperda TaxID=7108 RepID=A0A2H1VEH5_SPOFR
MRPIDSISTVDTSHTQAAYFPRTATLRRHIFITHLTRTATLLSISGNSHIGLANWSYVFIIVNITDPIVMMMGAAIVADLISDEYNYLRTKFIEIRIHCNNERHRSEFKQLQILLENYPLRFCILPNIPLTFSLFLCSISFAIINVIAVLQIESFYSDISADIV